MIVAKRSVYLGGNQKMAEKKKESFQFEHKVKQVFLLSAGILTHSYCIFPFEICIQKPYVMLKGFFMPGLLILDQQQSHEIPQAPKRMIILQSIQVLEKLPRGSQLTRSSRIHVQANDFITFMYTEALNCIVLHDVERFPKM